MNYQVEAGKNDSVSVVIPFYSGANWLEEAIESVLKQTFLPDEIIVVNDGSKEDISKLMAKYNTEVTFVNQENQGSASARNHGINISTGKYIAFLDSDDLWLPNKLETQIKYMIDNNLQWSHCPYEVFDDISRKIITKVDNLDTKGMMFPRLLARCRIGTPCVVIRRECINDRRMKFNEKMRQGQDYCFWNVLARRYELGNIGETLVRVRNHNTNLAKNVIAQLKTKKMMYDFLAENHEYFGDIPTVLSIGFKLSKIGFLICNRIKNKKMQNYLGYIFYVVPWCIFHLFYKISSINEIAEA